MADKKERPFYNRSLERALTILTGFNADRATLTLSQIVEIVKLPKTTVTRLCATLIEFGFLRYDPDSSQFSLGLKLLELGSVVFSTLSLRKVVSPYLTQLQLRLAKTAFLAILQDDDVIYIDKREDPRNAVLFASSIGTRRLPYFGMLGQVLMAFLPEVEVNRILQRKPLAAATKRSIVDEDRFKERLNTIRKNGFVVEEGEAIDGVTGISAPIRGAGNKVVAAIGVGFISSSEDENGKHTIIREVVNTAYDISQHLGLSFAADRPVPTVAGWQANSPV
jgi:DNA-binding IclR family transcriptional regulator